MFKVILMIALILLLGSLASANTIDLERDEPIMEITNPPVVMIVPIKANDKTGHKSSKKILYRQLYADLIDVRRFDI